MSPASITKIRNDREARVRRHVELARLLRDDPKATNVALAKALGVNRDTIAEDRKSLMAQVNESALTETQLYRQDQLTRIQDKWGEIENDESMSGAEKHLAWSRWMKLEMDLRGTAAPSKSIVGHVSGPQLDSLYLDIREVLLDLDDGDKQEALQLMSEFAKQRKKPVVITAKFITEGNNDANFS